MHNLGQGSRQSAKAAAYIASAWALYDSKKLLRGTNGNAGYIPKLIGEQLSEKTFKNFDDFRNDFWETVADSEFASEFSANNISRMKGGLAPIAHSSQQYKGLKSYVLHHITPINAGGGVYDMSNIMMVTPRMHQEILEKAYHFGYKGGEL